MAERLNKLTERLYKITARLAQTVHGFAENMFRQGNPIV
jgi:hypothetical protein